MDSRVSTDFCRLRDSSPNLKETTFGQMAMDAVSAYMLGVRMRTGWTLDCANHCCPPNPTYHMHWLVCTIANTNNEGVFCLPLAASICTLQWVPGPGLGAALLRIVPAMPTLLTDALRLPIDVANLQENSPMPRPHA